MIRDPRTETWYDISAVTGHPPDARTVSVDADLAGLGSTLHVTVVGSGILAQATCTVFPIPGGAETPAWPDNCAPFVDLSPDGD